MSTELFFEKNDTTEAAGLGAGFGTEFRADPPSAQAINPIATAPG
jgi:hypothetical protein